MHDTIAPVAPTVDEVADHMFAAFRPSHGRHPSSWPARDITIGQLKTLFMLRSQGPVSIGRIADAFGIGAAAASGYIERIERHGLLERRHRTDDRRIVECHLTEAGTALLEELAGLQIEALRTALGTLSPDELAEFDRLLTVISDQARPSSAGTC